MRLWATILAACVLLPGCESQPGSAENLGQRSDPAWPRSPLRELSGSWRGQADTPNHGSVYAYLVVGRSGVVTYQLTGAGVSMAGWVRIMDWTGSALHLADADGQLHTLPATLRGDRLEVTAPIVGSVSLQR